MAFALPGILGVARTPDRQPSVADRIRARMDAGVLRAIGAKTMWADFGQGNPCDGCGESILTSDIEDAFSIHGDLIYGFHMG
jgi:hypothetical protein